MSRGNEKQDIFLNRSDRVIFLQILEKVARENDWELYAYCLMNNHYHLALYTPAANLALGMKYLNGVYSQGFNVRHRRVGHLLQGRYTSKLVERESYLLALARYIVQNPVRANFRQGIEGWEWSSFRATAGLSACPSVLRTDLVLGLFASDLRIARESYVEFAQTPAKVEPWMKFEADRNHSPAQQGRRELSSIILNVTRKDKRNLEIVDAFVDHGYTMTEIAEFLGCHRSTVSKIISTILGNANSTPGVRHLALKNGKLWKNSRQGV